MSYAMRLAIYICWWQAEDPPNLGSIFAIFQTSGGGAYCLKKQCNTMGQIMNHTSTKYWIVIRQYIHN